MKTFLFLIFLCFMGCMKYEDPCSYQGLTTKTDSVCYFSFVGCDTTITTNYTGHTDQIQMLTDYTGVIEFELHQGGTTLYLGSWQDIRNFWYTTAPYATSWKLITEFKGRKMCKIVAIDLPPQK